MLRNLKIKNYALIEDIEIEIGDGLTTITGETGAGKSILLGAISLLAGNRTDRSMLKQNDKKCFVEATFRTRHLHIQEVFKKYDIDFEEENIIRREISPDGKSRVFINDSPAVLLHLKDIMNHLLDVHSQHENLELNNRKYQLNAIDIMAANQKVKALYRETYEAFLLSEKNLADIKNESEKQRMNAEVFVFQLNELSQAAPEENEAEELEKEMEQLEHAEEIRSGFFAIEEVFSKNEGDVISQLKSLNALIRKAGNFFSEIQALSVRMDGVIIEVEDIRREMELISSRFSFDPDRYQIVQDRLSLLYRLQQKYKVTSVRELREIIENLQREMAGIENYGERLEEATKAYEGFKKQARKLAKELSSSRFAVLTEMEEGIGRYLSALGMPNSRFKIELTEGEEMTADGYNRAEFLFSANKGMEVRSIGKVASGGELSRLMLSIKALMTSKSELPTILFDEIDTGISGEIAEKTGKIILDMCGTTQVLAITHLPQIAAMGDHHFVVYKDETGEISQTKIKEIKGKDRQKEIARLLSGEAISPEALENAKVLLAAKA